MASAEILCVGEVLWDALPAGLFLGGAPFNVACHLRAAGLPVTMVSRVGADQLGDEVLRRAALYGVGIDLIQVDPALPTGFVRVTVDETGNASYEVVEPAAWDAIAPDQKLLRRAAAARAIVFGSLAQRNPVTRGTIERLLDSEALLVFDANLRPPYDDPRVVRRSLERAGVVKVTEGELQRIAEWFDLPRAGGTLETVTSLAERFGCETVCVTRGREGAALWRDGRWSEHAGYEVEVRDTVGAGDAFLAVLLAGILAGTDDAAILQHATLMGAYVATQPGAVPPDQPAINPPIEAVGAKRQGAAKRRAPAKRRAR
jgi:fructokinase